MSLRDAGKDHRPWGWFQVLAEGTAYKIKTITVYPGMRLSLQRHRFRDEHWYVLEGEGIVTRDGEETVLTRGRSIDIPRGVLHRILNAGRDNFVVVEIQTGTYFGEDDIERIEDDFGRS